MFRFALLKSVSWYLCLLTTLGTLGIASRSAKAQTQPAIFPVATQFTISQSDVLSTNFIGDFNGDGVPDLAYVTVNSPSTEFSLGILLSLGSNAPATVTTLLCPDSAGPFPQVNFADVNNDKKLDLVFTCNGFLNVQLGNGDGTFQKAAYFSNLGGAPVFADFNGDGFLDIAVPASVLLNQGAGAPGVFASPKLYPIPDGAYGLVAGDFNGDGKQDLMTTIFSFSPSGFTGFDILSGNGDGTFNPAVTGATTPFYGSTTGDFNGDGVTDVALLLPSASTSFFTSVQIFLGSRSGTFTQGAALPVAAGPAPSTVPLPMTAIALTNDGNLDLVVGTNVLNVFRGDGKGGFTPSGSYAVQAGLFADVNGDGKPDLITPSSADGIFIFPGNGDGTFQAPPGTPVSGLVADLNNDGISDMVFPSPSGGNYFGAALGRGDGTFAILDQPTVLPTPPPYSGIFLVTGDFNGDGKVDTLAVQTGGGPGGNDPCATPPPNAQLLSYLGTGTGQFQAKGTAVALGVGGVTPGVTGDFNSDGKLDLMLRYSQASCQTLLLFVPGNGDGTFGTPVPLNEGGSPYVNLIAADLNNDQKLDFVWGSIVFLGNGDGTFRLIPLTIPPDSGGTVAAVAFADLNGDGILDAVGGPGTTIYAGNGDGTFQTTPFYTVPLPPNAGSGPFATGDVNGDGNPDLLVTESSEAAPFLAVYLGDGHGNFTQDTNAYYVVTDLTAGAASAPLPTRLNGQAPGLALDNRRDVLIPIIDGSHGTYELSLLNQTNPPPVKPAPITSSTALQAAPAAATPGAAITLTASVFGTNPTGSVSFTANGNSLGSETLVNGTAALQTSFANTGSYTVTATYPGDGSNTASTSTAVDVTIAQATTTTTLEASPSAGDVNGKITLKATVTGASPTGMASFAVGGTSLGTATVTGGVATLETSFAAGGSYATTATYKGDADNLASTSSPVTIVIATPDFTVAASPTSGSVTPGQTAAYTFTVTPVAGYSGTVEFSCGTLPSLAACSFSPTSVMPSGGSSVSTTMTVTTAASTAMLNPGQHSGRSWLPAGGLAMAAAFGLAFSPNKRRRRSLREFCWALLMASVSFSLLGCGGGGSNTPSNPGTPAGSYTISVNASGSAGGPQHGVSISLAVQ